MSPNSFPQFDADYARVAAAKSFQTSSSPECGFCGLPIRPDCLRIDSTGVVRVSLSSTAPEWFEMLTQLGEGLHLTRNPITILGELSKVPQA
jgi:hypothetical protein